jgi:hypothetical protein
MERTRSLFVTDDALYRVGNSTSPQFTKFRTDEITLDTINGVSCIIANNKGVSLFDATGLTITELTGWVWELPHGAPIDLRPKLNKDDNPPQATTCSAQPKPCRCRSSPG